MTDNEAKVNDISAGTNAQMIQDESKVTQPDDVAPAEGAEIDPAFQMKL
jgi:hypothetical protein